MSKGDAMARKADYFSKIQKLFSEYNRVFLVNVDNVGSNQMHQVRHNLRGQAVLLMGKNTMMRKAVRAIIPEQPSLEKLLPHLAGNIGLVFTNGDLKETRTRILSNRVAAPAKAGAIAPCDVWVKAVNTGMEPGKTSFFQALGIPTKIARGTIEIVSDVHLIKAGNKVGASEAALLNMLNISPFTYGLTVLQVFDEGTVFPPEILDISDESLLEHVQTGIQHIAALSLLLAIPTQASVPHLLAPGFKNLLATAVATDYSFKYAEKAKAYLANPEAFAAVAAPVAAASAPAAGSASPAKAAAKEETKEESDEDMGLGLFD